MDAWLLKMSHIIKNQHAFNVSRTAWEKPAWGRMRLNTCLTNKQQEPKQRRNSRWYVPVRETSIDANVTK